MPAIEKIEYEKRIRVVQEWILEDWPSVDIIAQLAQKWGVGDRQSKRYIAEARKRWVADDHLLVEHNGGLKSKALRN